MSLTFKLIVMQSFDIVIIHNGFVQLVQIRDRTFIVQILKSFRVGSINMRMYERKIWKAYRLIVY